MTLFNFRKKKANELKKYHKDDSLEKNHNTSRDSLDKLVDGDLPWGWITYNNDFIEPIETQYRYFLNMWVNARNKSPKVLYSSLKSFVMYMEDVEKLCKSKGECFEFWFNEILTGKGYLKQRKQELKILSENLSKSQNAYEYKQDLLLNLDSTLLNFLQNNNGILQKDVYKQFDPSIKSDVQNLLYDWEKSGKIKRIKLGNTYKITLQ